MKKLKTILQYILALILALILLSLVLIKIFSSTILNETYVLSKLDEEDYYNKIYESAGENFENYINQSGLDEEVLNNILTKEKIEKDTKTILHNIFAGLNETISTEEIANNLRQNIVTSLGRNMTATEEKAVESFIETICNEYKDTILHTNYENQINSAYHTVMKYINTVKKVLLIATLVCIVLIALLTIRRVYRVLARLGVALTVDGTLLLLAKNYIGSKVRIGDITILNNPVSIVIRKILTEILGTVNTYGMVLLVLGIIFILIYSIIKSIRKANRMKEPYTPEN